MTYVQFFGLITAITILVNLFFDPLWDFGKWVYHKICDLFGICYHPYGKKIDYEEEYNKEGEPFYHHTWRKTYCPKCGKVFRRDQLQ